MAYRETTSRKIISRRVKRLRKAMLLTREEFGQIFGVKWLQVWRWERGVNVPQLRHQRTLYAVEQRERSRNSELERIK